MKLFTYFVAIFLMINFSVASSQALSEMQLHGSGQANYLKFIKVYDAELYTAGQATDAEIVAGKVSKCLLLTYDVSLGQKDFIKAADTVLQRQFSPEELARVQRHIDALHNGYQDVKGGDQYSLCYDQETETTKLALNGNELVAIKSADFARVYFSIWLGEEKPLDTGLRDDLLARK